MNLGNYCKLQLTSPPPIWPMECLYVLWLWHFSGIPVDGREVNQLVKVASYFPMENALRWANPDLWSISWLFCFYFLSQHSFCFRHCVEQLALGVVVLWDRFQPVDRLEWNCSKWSSNCRNTMVQDGGPQLVGPAGIPEVQNPRHREISRASGIDFPIFPSFWWSTDTVLPPSQVFGFESYSQAAFCDLFDAHSSWYPSLGNVAGTGTHHWNGALLKSNKA